MDDDPIPKPDAPSPPLLPYRSDPRVVRLRRLAIRLGVLVLLIAIAYAFHQPILAAYARWFRLDDPMPSDAIVLLLGGIGHRPEQAAELYRDGIAPVIVMGTSERDDPLDPEESARTAELLVKFGVPRSAIRILPCEVTSTRDEAALIRHEAAIRGWKSLTVVTTAFHTRRAHWIFRKVIADPSVVIHMAAARHPNYEEHAWYRSDEGLVLYFGETLRLLYYWLRY